MIELQRTREWTFPTADGPSETLPKPEGFIGTIPDGISMTDIASVERTASSTYQIVDFKGVKYEHIVFNPDGDPAKTVGFTPTSYSGARKNPGNMHEAAIQAVASPDVPIDYLTPWYNHPAGSMRRADYKSFLKNSRLTKGTGREGDPFRPIDSALDIVDLYEKMGWSYPTYFSADAEGGRLLIARATAFGAARESAINGVFLNGMPGLVKVEGFTKVNVQADVLNRLRRLGHSAATLEVNGETQRHAKSNMPEVYPWHKYYAHQAPIPFFAHIPDSLRIMVRMHRAFNRHNDPNKPQDHAARLDLLAMMAMNDAPVSFVYGSDNPLGPASELKTFFDDFTYNFPNDLRSPNRTITLKIIENAGVDHHTGRPTGRTTVERRTFGFGAMLGLVEYDADNGAAAEAS